MYITAGNAVGIGKVNAGGITVAAGVASGGTANVNGALALDAVAGYLFMTNAGTTAVASGALYADAITGILHRKP